MLHGLVDSVTIILGINISKRPQPCEEKGRARKLYNDGKFSVEKSNREQVSKAVKNIVLVYADPIMLQTLTCLLNMNGYQVVNSFQTGRSALRYLKSGPQVDLVLLGCYLQDMDTVRFLHQMEQECLDRRLRVILTGPARYIELVEQGHLSNCVDYYMIEPYDPKDLLLALNMFSPVPACRRSRRWTRAFIASCVHLASLIQWKGTGIWVAACRNGCV